MKLLIDIGNTSIKLAQAENKKLVNEKVLPELDPQILAENLEGVDHAVVASVREEDTGWIKDNFPEVHWLFVNGNTETVIQNKYRSPESLGADRIALANGAWARFPNSNVLAIDIGTCITYDFVNERGHYLGGAISPGLHMRYKALHNYTGKLPLVEPNTDSNAGIDDLIGQDTTTSIQSGVQHGIRNEIDGVIESYKASFSDLNTIITGGDLRFFDKMLKNNIFVAPNLVLEGLNEILDYYVENKVLR